MVFLSGRAQGANTLGQFSSSAQLVIGHSGSYGNGSGKLGEESFGFRLGHSISLYLHQSGSNGIRLHHFRPFLRDGCADSEPRAQKCDSKGQNRIHDSAADAPECLGKEAAESAARCRAEGTDQQAEGESCTGDHGQGHGQLQSAGAQEHDAAKHRAASGKSEGGDVPEPKDQSADGSRREVAGVT